MDISLAPGAGGPRGSAPIGVLRILDREGFRARGISGNNGGSVAATFYAAGHTLDELEQFFLALEPAWPFGWTLPEGAGLLSRRGIESWLGEHIGWGGDP